MPLFGGRRRRAGQPAGELPKDAVLEEELSELAVAEDRRELDRAESDVEEAVSEATRADIRDIKLIEHGRCPQCKARTDNFLYTVVCPSCGWHRREAPPSGASVVHLDTGEKIECDHVYSAADELLCIKDGIVISQVMRRCVRRIEHVWEESEFAVARERAKKRRAGVCSWCVGDLSESEEEGPYEDFVALGAAQERHVFCSEKCMSAFRKRYPSRVHRNCYETDCSACDDCVKRYDVDGFRRHIL
jgi:hypothetical protein